MRRPVQPSFASNSVSEWAARASAICGALPDPVGAFLMPAELEKALSSRLVPALDRMLAIGDWTVLAIFHAPSILSRYRPGPRWPDPSLSEFGHDQVI